MNVVAGVIASHIAESSARFVFPSETAASMWARSACGFTGLRSVAADRFLAWDRFKEEAVQAEVKERRPVSAVLRRLFAGDLVGKNAAALRSGPADGRAFRALIPPEYAEDGGVFTASIAGILPSLSLWEDRQADSPPDDEDLDLAFLKKEYAAFLERGGLFEPAWERPPLRDREHDYYIFFYDAMEDFEEFGKLLRPEKTIHLVAAPSAETPPLYLYDNSRAEIRAAVLEIRALHDEKGIPWDDIAVSVPGYEDMEPYLLREFSLYNVPSRNRSGRFLSDYNTGRLFALAGRCAANNFSFTSLKALLLNEYLPWRCPDLNRELAEFGIENNCVSGYRENGKVKDIWLEAFKKNPGEKKLERYYRDLRAALLAMTESETFSGIRKRYFAFRGPLWNVRDADGAGRDWTAGFLSAGAVTGEGNAVLARCVEELSALVRLEEEYPDIIPKGEGAKGYAFNFFLSVLMEKRYVPQRRGGGVNIFPYRVAAASPFAFHFVLNASQDAASVRYRPLRFLRGDKRARLGFADRDVSDVFFRLYLLPAEDGGATRTRISAAGESFSGWTIPHSFFAGRTEQPPAPPPDPFMQERAWWARGPIYNRQGGAGATDGFPSALFSVQHGGFERWRRRLAGGPDRFSLLRGPFPPALHDILRAAVAAKQRAASGALRVSATGDLDPFMKCPLSWFYRKILDLKEFSLEAKMLDDASLGLLYHEILRNLFEKIRAEDGVFRSCNMERYREWTLECTGEAARHYEAFQGPLASPVLSAQARAVTKRLHILLKTEARYFDGYTVGELEARLETERNGMLLGGIIDRVSVSPGGGSVIIDYKTGGSHSKKDSTETEDSPLRDFQIPLYIMLYEGTRETRTEGAFFMLVNQHKLVAVMGNSGGTRGGSREEFQATLEAVDWYLEQFKSAAAEFDFSPRKFHFSGDYGGPGVPLEECAACVYRGICRTAFFLNRRPAEDSPEDRHVD
ncbi:MAG: PD-(D/E)XK nuclease family protein [Treponema sp.]|nr:PD-(D/E)XK nuclease family protein [Treponema sp.]